MHLSIIHCTCRSFLDAKCENTNTDRFDWENWQYVHRTVRLFIKINIKCWRGLVVFMCIIQDIPKQTNGFDCGVQETGQSDS